MTSRFDDEAVDPERTLSAVSAVGGGLQAAALQPSTTWRLGLDGTAPAPTIAAQPTATFAVGLQAPVMAPAPAPAQAGARVWQPRQQPQPIGLPPPTLSPSQAQAAQGARRAARPGGKPGIITL